MKTKFLFPNSYKRMGWMICIPGIILGILHLINGFDIPTLETTVFSPFGDGGFLSKNDSYFFINNIVDEIAGILIIVGGTLIGFSKEKMEDEYISKIRSESLIWATYVNYGILLVALIFVYGLNFLNIMAINMFTILLIFIIRFQYLLYKNNKAVNYEE